MKIMAYFTKYRCSSPSVSRCHLAVLNYLESLHHKRDDDIPLLVGELPADGQQHEHVVTGHHTHRIQVTQHIRTRYPTLHTLFTIKTAGYRYCQQCCLQF